MTIAIIGGTGTLGRLVQAELIRRGREVRVVSRGSSQFPADVSSGEGLAAALRSCDTVVDASNATSGRRARQVLIEGTRRLLAAGQEAGVRHHVGISIVGCAKAPMGYYRVKTRQEQLIEAGPLPWTLVCATQFHELAAAALTAAGRFGVIPVPKMLIQTVAAAEVARAVADVADGDPQRRRVSVAGPEVRTAAELARTWKQTAGRRALLVPVAVPGQLGRELRDGALTTPEPEIRGQLTFAGWLAATS